MKTLKIGSALATAAIGSLVWGGPGTALATELYSGGTTQGINTQLKASLASGTTSTFSTTDEKTLVDTCVSSELAAKIESTGGSAAHPRGNVETLSQAGCSHTTDSIPIVSLTSPPFNAHLGYGELEIRHIAGTTNGSVRLSVTEVTVQSTTFGVSCVAAFGLFGPTIGTLTGVKEGYATIDVNAVVPSGFLCGGDMRWKATYTVTSPFGLHTEAS